MHAQIDIGKKNVLIIGVPASGKTHVAKLLHKDNPNHVLIHTDDYIKYGYEQSLYVLLQHLSTIRTPTIIEGVLGYRLLRKGAQLQSYHPDIVIELEVPESTLRREYMEHRRTKDFAAVLAFNKSLQTVLAGYKRLAAKRVPQWIHLKNNY